MATSAVRHFVVVQPGCDMMAADVFHVWDGPDCRGRAYLVEHGVDERFFVEAEIGDACFFDKERVVIRIGRVFWLDGWQ